MDRVDASQRFVPTYARTCGILSMILAIIAVLLPVSGIVAITPVVVVLGIVSLLGGYQLVGIGVIAICAFHLATSPIFWSDLDFRSATHLLIDRTMAYFDAIGILSMCLLMFKGKREQS